MRLIVLLYRVVAGALVGFGVASIGMMVVLIIASNLNLVQMAPVVQTPVVVAIWAIFIVGGAGLGAVWEPGGGL